MKNTNEEWALFQETAFPTIACTYEGCEKLHTHWQPSQSGTFVKWEPVCSDHSKADAKSNHEYFEMCLKGVSELMPSDEMR